jgi:hypothetical protein
MSACIETLRRRISTDQDLSSFWKYFLDNLANDPHFIDSGQPCEAPYLEDLLEMVGRHVYGKSKVRVADSLWIGLRDYDLIHGTCSIQNRMTGAIYFPGLKIGVAGFHTSGSRMVYSRFSPPDLTRLPVRGTVQ